MADEPENEVGFYKIEKALLRRWNQKTGAFEGIGGVSGGYNIAQYIGNVSFLETMNSPYFEGAMTIVDSSDMISKLPIKGEELLTLTYRDFFKQTITQDYIVYSVSMNTTNDQQNRQTYILKFASPQLMISDSKVIKKTYTGTIKKMIEDMFKEHLQSHPYLQNTKLPLEVEDTDGDNQKIIIPGKSPLSGIDMLRRKAYSTKNKSSNFYFFQTRKKYIMATHEKLIEDGKKFLSSSKQASSKIYTHSPGLHANEQPNVKGGPPPKKDMGVAMNNIIEISWPDRKDTTDEMLEGAVRQDIVEIDYINKQYKQIRYNYIDSHRDYKHLDMDKTLDKYNNWHTDSFLKVMYPNDKEPVYSTLVFNDVERKEAHYVDIEGPRRSTSYYLSNVVCNIKIYGRNDLNVGDVIKLNVPQYETVEGTKPMNFTLAGFWLIREISHVLAGKTYEMDLVITKDLPGLGGGSGGTKQANNASSPTKTDQNSGTPKKTGAGFTVPAGGDPRGMEATIREAAIANGIDPDVAVRVANAEGLRQFYGDNNTSFGAFQLHVGGYNGSTSGVGTVFQNATGLDPSDPANEAQTIWFAMDFVRRNGWSQWNGAKAIGVYGFDGVNRGAGYSGPEF